MSDDIAGLVERLEAGIASRIYGDASREAASTIRALLRKNERWKRKADTFRQLADIDLERAKAAEAKLREAVEVIRDLLDWAENYLQWDIPPTHDAVSPARAFLATTEKKDA
jgi:hypothetical protein